ncbi:hypothetical protein OIU91_43110 (plasmid) [Streptomyces sp. NBC_01456]|uniref:hypothetical protein n=1 Tax=unclassified Streptomyces TaxID=2593676 RepID=UPI002E34A9F6|nr:MULTISPECIES: hypothetical protein [unclassified Streptomyces]
MSENMPTYYYPQLTPAQVQLAFDYVLAVDADDTATVDQLTVDLLPHAGLLVAIAQELVFPVTALGDDIEDVCADSFALNELGVVFLMAIRTWASDCPASAAPAIARCIAHFVCQVFVTDPQEGHRALEVIRDGRVEQARAAHSAVGEHR